MAAWQGVLPRCALFVRFAISVLWPHTHMYTIYYMPGLQCKRVSFDIIAIWTTLSQVYPNPIFTTPSQVQ